MFVFDPVTYGLRDLAFVNSDLFSLLDAIPLTVRVRVRAAGGGAARDERKGVAARGLYGVFAKPCICGLHIDFTGIRHFNALFTRPIFSFLTKNDVSYLQPSASVNVWLNFIKSFVASTASKEFGIRLIISGIYSLLLVDPGCSTLHPGPGCICNMLFC